MLSSANELTRVLRATLSGTAPITIHYSNPNRCDTSRRALLMVYRGAHCAPDPALQERYQLARQS